jgi:hypothetical protein
MKIIVIIIIIVIVIETFLCFISDLQAKIVFLLDALQLLMLFVWTFSHFEMKLFPLIIFYNGTFLTIKITMHSI